MNITSGQDERAEIRALREIVQAERARREAIQDLVYKARLAWLDNNRSLQWEIMEQIKAVAAGRVQC